MSIWLALAIGSFIIALIPAIVFAGNLGAFRRLPESSKTFGASLAPISVLIPARNEEANIGRAVESVLANAGVTLELIVLDDQSTDQTAAIVAAMAEQDPRIRLITAPPLPAGWCGKQHACQVLADSSRYDTLVWMDADVELASDALERMAVELARNRAALISGFPFETTGTWLESLLIPLIHFVLLGFLPLRQMRRSLSPAMGAGCGQLFMARRKDYFEAGGHAAIYASLHDGIALPRAFRRAGKGTDLFDASDIATCRMYASARTVWKGLLKNAGEGIATATGILPWTILLGGGQIIPAALAIYLCAFHPGERLAVLFAVAATLGGIGIRLVCAHRYYGRRPMFAQYVSALFHPIGVLLFLVIQWQSLLRRFTGQRSSWRGRSY